MALVEKLLILWFISVISEVLLSSSEIALVIRDVTDSFRVGKDGCLNNTAVCSIDSTCELDGLCLCNSNQSFRNPDIVALGTYGQSYGCVTEMLMYRDGSVHCPFAPFQVIPYDLNKGSVDFSIEQSAFTFVVNYCKIQKSWVKYPDNYMETELFWLNDSYLLLNFSMNTMHFRWRKSVPNLQGTIIRIEFTCFSNGGGSSREACLRAKVLGTWSGEPTSVPQVVNSTSAPQVVNSTSLVIMPSISTNPSSGARSSGDDGIDTTILAIAVAVPAVVLIIVMIVVCHVYKRRVKNRRGKILKSDDRDGTSPPKMKEFRHTDSNLRGPLAYDGLQDESAVTFDLSPTVNAHTNSGYATPDVKRHVEKTTVMSKEQKSLEDPNNGYANINVLESARETFLDTNSGYATPDVKRPVEKTTIMSKEQKSLEDPNNGYANINVLESASQDDEPGESVSGTFPAEPRHAISSNSSRSTSDIKRIEVNGDLYAVVDKDRTGDDEATETNDLNYMNPSALAMDAATNDGEIERESDQPTQYAQIAGCLEKLDTSMQV